MSLNIGIANAINFSKVEILGGIANIPPNIKNSITAWWSPVAQGLDNVYIRDCLSKGKNPLLKDIMGKYDMELYKFKGYLDSGVGRYVHDFTKWIFKSTNWLDKRPESVILYDHSVITLGIKPWENTKTFRYKITTIRNPFNKKTNYQCYIAAESTQLGRTLIHFNIVNTVVGSTVQGNFPIVYDKMDEFIADTSNPNPQSSLIGFWCRFFNDKSIYVKLEQVPTDKGLLCFNGLEYCRTMNTVPFGDNYTIIINRKIAADTSAPDSDNIGSTLSIGTSAGLKFQLEQYNTSVAPNFIVQAGDATNEIDSSKVNKNLGIQVITPNKYNDVELKAPSTMGSTQTIVTLGASYGGVNLFKGAIGDVIIFNRVLTDEEIDYVKNNMMHNK